METLETIGKRASLKAFLSAREVEEEKITKILDAARFAPSAGNKQPWRFIVVRGKENVENVVFQGVLWIQSGGQGGACPYYCLCQPQR